MFGPPFPCWQSMNPGVRKTMLASLGGQVLPLRCLDGGWRRGAAHSLDMITALLFVRCNCIYTLCVFHRFVHLLFFIQLLSSFTSDNLVRIHLECFNEAVLTMTIAVSQLRGAIVKEYLCPGGDLGGRSEALIFLIVILTKIPERVYIDESFDCHFSCILHHIHFYRCIFAIWMICIIG